MRIGFLLERPNYRRIFGPIMAAAVRRGWEVIEAFDGDCDVAVALRPPSRHRPFALVGLQYTLDLGGLIDSFGETPFQRLAIASEYWREHASEAVRIIAGMRGVKAVHGDAIQSAVKDAAIVGSPWLDQTHHLPPAAVLRKYGLPNDRPLVIYFPFPFHSNPKTFWTRWYRVAGERKIARAIRAFCDANGAALVAKCRDKDPASAAVRRIADFIIYDPTFYPATSLELLSVASLAIHYHSTVAYEAAYMKVPSLCLTTDHKRLGFPAEWSAWFLSETPHSGFNWRGVVYLLDMVTATTELPHRRLRDFAIDGAERDRYVERFVGPDDGRASECVLDVASSAAAAGYRI